MLLLTGNVRAQDTGSPDADLTLLRQIYAWDAPLVTVPLRVADGMAYPAFALLPMATYAADGDWRPAARMVVSEAAAVLAVGTLKRVVRRPRPYVGQADVSLRSHRFDRAVLGHDGYGFPSGHATIAFAAATSLSLDYPAWYVVVPAHLWAGSLALSRIWHGAHYPSDVLAGAVLGFVVAGAVHVLWPGEARSDEPVVVPVSLRLTF